MKNPFHKKEISPQEAFIRSFLDCIAPGVVKFEVDHYIFGNTYRCVWALREYPASTESQAILRHLGEKSGVTLRIYCRQVSPGEEDRIIDNANKKNKLDGSDPNKLRQTVEAESNLRDVAELVHKMHREHEPLLHCAVYLEMTADSMGHLRQLQTDVLTELVRCKLNVDKLLLRQKQGFYCASPVGYNALGREFERVLPAGSVANLYPFNYSGKTDPNGFYIGKDKYGSNIVVDFDRRDSDKTSANILILGNSGQGKSYLMKLLICNLLEAGKSVISLDAEHELEELCGKLGGCFIDLMAGEKRINVLEVRCWNEDTDMETDESAPEAFRKSTLLARHISFLKDFFRAYKDFSDPQLDTIEIMLSALYKKWGISEETDFRQLKPGDYPVLSDLYALINNELVNYRNGSLYTRELLQEVLLGLHSLCVGADAPFFNGHTNISDDMRDVIPSIYQATRPRFATAEEQLRKLLNLLDGMELTSAGHLTAQDFSFSDEILMENGKLSFYVQADFDVDAAFGTFVCTDENDDWLNIYANYDIAQDRPCDTLELNLCKGDGTEENWSYHLNAAEQEVLARKMEAFCQQQNGMSLHDFARRLQEEPGPSQQIQM